MTTNTLSDPTEYVGNDGVISHLAEWHLQKPAVHPPLAEWDQVRFACLKLFWAWVRRVVGSL